MVNPGKLRLLRLIFIDTWWRHYTKYSKMPRTIKYYAVAYIHLQEQIIVVTHVTVFLSR